MQVPCSKNLRRQYKFNNVIKCNILIFICLLKAFQQYKLLVYNILNISVYSYLQNFWNVLIIQFLFKNGLVYKTEFFFQMTNIIMTAYTFKTHLIILDLTFMSTLQLIRTNFFNKLLYCNKLLNLSLIVRQFYHE